VDLEGIFIYWIGWGLWAIISFFWPKTLKRFWSAVLLLCFLIVLPISVQVGYFHIHFAFICFFLYLCWHMKLLKTLRLFHLFIVTTTIAAAHGGFQMLLIFDPVIEYVDSRWMAAGLIALIAFLLCQSLSDRLLAALFGLVQGELLTNFVLHRHLYMEPSIGSLYFFDIVALVSLLFSAVWFIRQLSTWIVNQLVTEQKQKMLKQSS
jgi:hypothetical protein